MKQKDIEKIESLAEKFFDGETTQAEEQRLYDFFTRRDVPPQLEKYRRTLTAFGLVSKHTERKSARTVHIWRIVTSVAAAVVLLFGVVIYLDYHKEQTLAANYGGSYVIVNGQRIDDLSRIQNDIKTVLSDASAIERRATEASIADKAEQEVLQNITNPEMRQQVMEMLK